MDAFSPGDDPPDSPEGMLDALRDDPGAGEDARDAQLARIVERFPADRLREAVMWANASIACNEGDGPFGA